MLRPVARTYASTSGNARVRLVLKCGHITMRDAGHQWLRVHCAMCTLLSEEREHKDTRRAEKKKRRELRKRRLQRKVEEMAKKKMASKKVAKKKDLKKKGGKGKKDKKPRHKTGKKWFLPNEPKLEKGSVVEKVIKAFKNADERVIGENDLIALLEKEGMKPQGKKTVKKLVKAAIRNLSRSGMIIKDRGRDKDEDEEDEDEESEDESEDSEEEDGESEDADEESEDGEVEDEEEKPKKKKVIKKKAKK